MSPEQMTDDALFDEVVYWSRVSRNEGRLPPEDRAKLKAAIDEINRRGIGFKHHSDNTISTLPPPNP